MIDHAFKERIFSIFRYLDDVVQISSLSDLGPVFSVCKSSRKRGMPQPADNLPAEARSVEPEPEHEFPSLALPLNSHSLQTVAFLLSKVSTSTAFAFSLSIVCTPSWQQLQHFDLSLQVQKLQLSSC